MNWNGDWGWGAWAAMSTMMVVFWTFVVWGILMLVRGTRGSQTPTAQEILDERLARGEISITEFDDLSRAVRGQV